MPNLLQIETVHLTATGPAGETFAVVTYVNGRCGLTRDGQPLPELDWPADQLADCTAALARLAVLDD